MKHLIQVSDLLLGLKSNAVLYSMHHLGFGTKPKLTWILTQTWLDKFLVVVLFRWIKFARIYPSK